VSQVCRVLNFNRSRFYRHRARRTQTEQMDFKATCRNDKIDLTEKIQTLCGQHPSWGTRRITNWLQKRENMCINRKRVQRIMREQNLILKPKKKRAGRESKHRKPIPDRPHQWWGIDMSKFMVENIGWIYIVAIIDWFSRKVVGYAVDRNCRTELWIQALEQAVLEEFPNGSRQQHLFLMSDNGSQPTSQKFRSVAQRLEIQPTYTAYSNPKGNANTERWFRTFKEDCVWIHEWNNFKDVKNDINKWIEFYNNLYPHSALDGYSPNEFMTMYSLKKAA
jgi:putative transposase